MDISIIYHYFGSKLLSSSHVEHIITTPRTNNHFYEQVKQAMKHKSFFETLREQQFSRLDAQHHIYLDYTGSGLYPSSLPRAHQNYLQKVYGNPHTASPASIPSTRLLESTRRQVLIFFNADPDRYTVIFTPNATGAIKLVGECFPFTRHSTLVLSCDNHNSVLGIREYAQRAGAHVRTIPLDDSLRLHRTSLKRRDETAPNLLAYPAQSNFSGVKHPLSLIERAHASSYDVLLDAAAFVPTNPLDLSRVHPEFVPISFYKMFGYPTGIGALIVKRSALRRLHKRWFAGGTVRYVSVAAHQHTLADGAGGWEDGTVDFLAMPAVKDGLEFLSDIGVERIRRHVTHLTETLLHGLLSIRHTNGSEAIVIHGPTDMHQRGGTIAFDVLGIDGERVEAKVVERTLGAFGVSVRSGCFCNPGCAEKAYGIDKHVLKRCARDGADVEEVGKCLGISMGSLRVSVGMACVQRDITRFLEILEQFVHEL